MVGVSPSLAVVAMYVSSAVVVADEGVCTTPATSDIIVGATCWHKPCYDYRNATCEGHRFCKCQKGQCVMNGACVELGACATVTDGSCDALPCHGWRRAACQDGACVCKADECAVAGECVKKGGCPRYAGSSCIVFKNTGLFDCRVGQCSDTSDCECAEDECFVDGKCVKNDDVDLVQLSRTQAVARYQAKSDMSTLAALSALAMSASVVVFLSLRLRAAQKLHQPPLLG